MIKLHGYEYEIIYKSDKENNVADSLSRESGLPTIWAICKPYFNVWAEMRRATFESPSMLKISALDVELGFDNDL